MTNSLHPAVILFAGALVLPFLPGKARKTVLILAPVLGLLNVHSLEQGDAMPMVFMGLELNCLRVDKLSLLFGYLFHIAALLGAIYAVRLKDRVQLVAALLYAGSAVGVVFAGDLLTLFVFWELLAITSVFLIWARRSKTSFNSGIRYLLMHVSSGLLVLAGAAVQYHQTGSLAFESMSLSGMATWLIFIGFGIKCGFPLLHTWLVDSYPEATPVGTVFLSSFTTKAAVYALARGFPGAEELVVIGTIMTMFPIFFAVIENNLRRVLSYSMINQIGFMVVGIGIGTPLAINGAVAHAFNDVIFKGLLFMSMGAVLLRTGRIKGTDLGGLYKSMPLTAGFCMVGAASISAFPLFSGFVSKSMVLAAAGQEGYLWVWVFLLIASAGVFHHAGIKIPYFAFFGHDSGIRTKEAPTSMLVAMGLAAFLCIFNGAFPTLLYSLLPYPVDFVPYTLTHVVTQTQLLFFSALAFTTLMLLGVYPREMRAVNLDIDWFYRKGGRLLYRGSEFFLSGFNTLTFEEFLPRLVSRIRLFFREAPSHLMVGLLMPVWIAQSKSRSEIFAKKQDYYEKARLGALPIGVTACLAVLLLGILFWF